MLEFKRALRRFVSKLSGKNKLLFFIVLAMLCIMAISIGIYTQFFYKYADTDPLMIGINTSSEKTAEELQLLEANFNNLFKNSLQVNSENVNITTKLDEGKDLVYTGYKLENEDENYFSVNAVIPVLNINTEKAKEINKAIKSEFHEKANSVMRQQDTYTVYNVTYTAYINNDILSVVIKASLREGDKSEKVSIKTYNYSLSAERQVTLAELVELKGETVQSVQSTINSEIKTAYNNAKIIAAEYGNLYERDLNSDMYKVENATTYFLTDDGYVYVLYPYGNTDYTNEMDIVIF
jgi:hypothetical protein